MKLPHSVKPSALDSKSLGKVAFENGGAIAFAILLVIIVISFIGNLLFH